MLKKLFMSCIFVFFSNMSYSDDQHSKKIKEQLKATWDGYRNQQIQQQNDEQLRSAWPKLMGVWIAVVMCLEIPRALDRQMK